MTHILVPKETLQQVLAVVLDARTTDDSEHKWGRNSKAEKAVQTLLDAPCYPDGYVSPDRGLDGCIVSTNSETYGLRSVPIYIAKELS